jgi:ABC transporter, phosphonate, periplasmic substrate-binding protein
LAGKTFRRIAFAVAFLLLFLFSGQSVCISTITSNNSLPREFYYYNPDSPQSNLGSLKQEFDVFLSENNFSYTFQPFTHFADFHRLNNENRPAFILVPEWYYRQYGKALGLRPLLVPVRHGNTSYKKILLIAPGSSVAANDYGIISFAMTTMGPAIPTSVIKGLLPDGLGSLQQLNIINVPKDLDAILALVLGQVKMALVAQDNLQTISDANPRIVQRVKKLDKTVTVPMPMICYLADQVDKEDVERFITAFMKMAKEHPRNKIMEMLQIDDWQKLIK